MKVNISQHFARIVMAGEKNEKVVTAATYEIKMTSINVTLKT